MKHNRLVATLMTLALFVAFSGVASAEWVRGKVARIEGKKVAVTTRSGKKTFDVTGRIRARKGDEVRVNVVKGKARSLYKARVRKVRKSRQKVEKKTEKKVEKKTM